MKDSNALQQSAFLTEKKIPLLNDAKKNLDSGFKERLKTYLEKVLKGFGVDNCQGSFR